MSSWQRGNLTDRSYDVAIPAPLLAKIKDRRFSPDGLVHTVKEKPRGNDRVYVYPWSKMELGDFFIVPIGQRTEKSMRTAFYQAAARHDYEIAVTPWEMPGGFPGLRVTLVIIGVNQYRVKAEQFTGKKRPISDGKWKVRRREWHKTNKPVARPQQKPAKGNLNDPWRNDAKPLPRPKSKQDEELDADHTVYQEPTHTLTDAERRRIALERAANG